jgi:spermidine synthase
MGGGEGLLIRELLKYPEIKQITHIELDEEVLNIGRNHPIISKLNKRSLWDPRVKTIISDAFYFLRNSNKQYDAIFLDFPYPKNLNLAKLYSIEFYRYVNRNLKDDGFLVLDGPAYNKGEQNKKENQNRVIMAPSFNTLSYEFNNVLFSSIFYAGFRKYVPFKIERESFVMATKKPRVFDFDFKNWDRSKFNKVKLKDLQKIRYQYFPHKLDKSQVNSIFKPTILTLK